MRVNKKKHSKLQCVIGKSKEAYHCWDEEINYYLHKNGGNFYLKTNVFWVRSKIRAQINVRLLKILIQVIMNKRQHN